MDEQVYFLHALSPLHAGIGTGVGVIDLPIARQKATGIPFVPGSSIKGVLRDVRNPQKGQGDPEHNQWLATFGPEMGEADKHAGAVRIEDARLLALPVRSFKGTFAWVTSPLLLRLAARDMKIDLPVPDFTEQGAIVTGEGSLIVHAVNDRNRLYLQDIDLDVLADQGEAGLWAERLAPVICEQGPDIFSKRFAIIDDETMTFLWETATQIDVRNRLNECGVVVKGALWQEESLPPETLLIGLMAADKSRRKDTPLEPSEIMETALSKEEILQFGGKATVGRGRCRILPFVRGGRDGNENA